MEEECHVCAASTLDGMLEGLLCDGSYVSNSSQPADGAVLCVQGQDKLQHSRLMASVEGHQADGSSESSSI